MFGTNIINSWDCNQLHWRLEFGIVGCTYGRKGSLQRMCSLGVMEERSGQQVLRGCSSLPVLAAFLEVWKSGVPEKVNLGSVELEEESPNKSNTHTHKEM